MSATDALTELRRLAAQASPAAPYVRVSGAFLDSVADELAAFRKREDERLKAMLFEPTHPQQERTVL